MVFQKNAAFNRHHRFENSINASDKFQKDSLRTYSISKEVLFQT